MIDIYFVQNFTRFLLELFNFTVRIILLVKNAKKDDPVWIFTSEKLDLQKGNFISFFHQQNGTYSKNALVHQKAGAILNKTDALKVSFTIFWCLWKWCF